MSRLARAIRPRRGRDQQPDDRGAALVEFALVSVLLFTLVFGIISFGVVLSFKQTVTEAANEAARDAAVIQDDTSTTPDERIQAAQSAILNFEGWGRDCSHPYMACDIEVHDCSSPADGDLSTPEINDSAVFPDCITVRLAYDYAAAPIVPDMPFVSGFMPNTVETTATAQLTFPGP
jgi:Flp pilus assembly protein TadG